MYRKYIIPAKRYHDYPLHNHNSGTMTVILYMSLMECTRYEIALYTFVCLGSGKGVVVWKEK